MDTAYIFKIRERVAGKVKYDLMWRKLSVGIETKYDEFTVLHTYWCCVVVLISGG